MELLLQLALLWQVGDRGLNVMDQFSVNAKVQGTMSNVSGSSLA